MKNLKETIKKFVIPILFGLVLISGFLALNDPTNEQPYEVLVHWLQIGNFYTVTPTQELVSDATGKVSSIVYKRRETYSGTTNGSGVYTVTFPVAFSAAPNIQANMTSQSVTNQYSRISAISTTGFTINVYSLVTNNVLGIINLTSSVANVSGATIDVLITEK